MKNKLTRPTGVQFPLIYQAPIDAEMDEFIKRAAWEMGKKLGVKISLAEFGRRRILNHGWKADLERWRKTQTDYDPNEFAGRKRLEVVNGNGHNPKRNSGAHPAVLKRAVRR